MNFRHRPPHTSLPATAGRHASLWCLLLGLAACASGFDVSVREDIRADFAGYRTFAFAPAEPGATGLAADPLARTRVQTLITRELAAKGYVPAAAGARADLLVRYAGGAQQRDRVYMEGPGGGWQGYGWRQDIGRTDSYDYRQAALVVDALDAATKQLAWQARISGPISEGYSEANWTRLADALAQAFKSFPPAQRG